MNDLRVRDVMNPSVVVVTADCTCEHVVDVITEFGVSGVPVVRDDDRVIGIISEADLLPRLHPADAVPSPGEPAAVRRKADAHTAGELMTAPPVTVTAGSLVSTAAALMEQHRVKRLPVLDDATGILVGIVTRRDLLRGALRSDETIERELMEELLVHGLWFERAGITAAVQDGVVTLSGSAEHRRDALTAVRIAGAVDGVVTVLDNTSSPIDTAPVVAAGLAGTASG
ncbi:CBS domain-containing protein [Dactylosporangium cerinum]|uniref:CBS domain-containing protein n=1 Tax=Dactylosporangium cerinum TaxID=1434730 RepID=A0ABV9VWS3_9ACTN